MIDYELTPNAPLLLKTLHHIEAFPQQWDQGVYRCGTAMCFAGTACDLDGGVWLEDDEDCLAPREDDDLGEVGLGGIHAGNRARRILGLSNRQAAELFAASNSLNDLRRVVGDLCGEEAV